MNRKVKFTILAIVILITISVYLISQKEIEPPPAILKIDGKEQISGIGSYCWKGTWKALCVDMIGIPTAQEPLVASSPFTAHLRLPVQESPYDLYDLRLYVVRVKDEDELNFSGHGWRWWKERGEKNFTLPLEHEQGIELSLEPGLYVLSIDAWWKDIGSASYGFLVEVQANGKPDLLKVNPVIDYNPLEGFHNISEGMFTVIKGSIPEVKESLKDIIIKKAVQQSTFSVDNELNFIVFRGVFGTGGYAIIIDRVEKQRNAFTVYATYSEPGKGVGVTEAVTQPVAIIPIGKLAAGDYKARLKVTRVIVEDVGIKVIETEKELSNFNFTVKSIAAGNHQESVPSESLEGQIFDEASGILTKNWDAENFAGFWRDPEANISTETLVINQSALNNTHRVIEKYNLIYTTKSVPLKYQVYMHVNKTPPGTEGFYSAIGWQGEKYALLQGNRIARIIFEQNATDIKTMQGWESWGFGDGYKLSTNSIDVPLRGEEQAWITFFKDNVSNLDDKVSPNNYLYSYIWDVNDSLPVFLTYISNIRRLPYTNAADFRYTWLRSQNITEIKEGDVFGIMEVTSVKNSNIELRNKNPIGLAPGNTIHLMGDISIHVGNSETELLFYPAKLKNLDMPSTVNQTPPSNATIPPAITTIQPDAGAIGTKVVITGTGFTTSDNNVAFRLEPGNSSNLFKVGYINGLISYDSKTIEFAVPEWLSACAFPLIENVACPAIALLFKPGTHTYPVFIVNQNGTSNSINFTVSR